MNSPAKLTDTQFAMLSEASQRKDRCLIPPKTLKAAAAQKVATKLLKAGLVREIKAKTGAQVIELLQRGDGATLAELVAATGWLPHTTRAALTGLRKRGYAVGIDRADKVRGSVYRIEPTGMEEDSAAPHAEASQTCEAPPDRPTPPDGFADSRRARRTPATPSCPFATIVAAMAPSGFPSAGSARIFPIASWLGLMRRGSV